VSDAEFGSNSLHLQLHGMGSGAGDPEFSISDGTTTNISSTSHLGNMFASSLGLKIKAAGSTKSANSCNHPLHINKMCGEWNTQGRYTNGVLYSNTCTQNTTQASGRFLHLEMSKDLRYVGYGPLSSAQVIDTVKDVIPTL